jgi:hypothetical protein
VDATSPRRKGGLIRRRGPRLLTVLGLAVAVALGGCTPDQRDRIRESIGGSAGGDGESEVQPEEPGTDEPDPEQPGVEEPGTEEPAPAPDPEPEPDPDPDPDPDDGDDVVEEPDPEPDDVVAADDGGTTDDGLTWLLVLLGIVIAAATVGFLLAAARRKRDRGAAEGAVLADTAWLLGISDQVPLPPGSDEQARSIRRRTELMQDRLSELAADTSGDEARVVLELRDAAAGLGTTVLARLHPGPADERSTRTLDVQLGERRERLRAARRAFLVRTGRDPVEV